MELWVCKLEFQKVKNLKIKMPRKERVEKKIGKELQNAAKGCKSVTSFFGNSANRSSFSLR